jgi:hypothetical protein
MVGQFRLGLVFIAPIIMFSNLRLRSIQVTDPKQEYQIMQYLKNLIKTFIKNFIRRQQNWSIAIYTGVSPFSLSAPDKHRSIVLSAKDVTDVLAEFVADPFMVHENGNWYMFFEVLNARTQKGDIGLATSADGFNWTYQQIVMDESFHLSYPYVFKWNDTYYMIPESYQANSIRLYQAVDFPTKWSLVKILIDGSDFVDSSIVHYQDKWWLFTSSRKGDTLYLYYADDLKGEWTEHPMSPIIKEDLHIARPGGRVIVFNGKVFRYAQDVQPIYGNQVRAFEITELTTTSYRERAVKENPIIKAGKSGWNSAGMHTVDPWQIDKEKWIACVDGYTSHIKLKYPRKVLKL